MLSYAHSSPGAAFGLVLRYARSQFVSWVRILVSTARPLSMVSRSRMRMLRMVSEVSKSMYWDRYLPIESLSERRLSCMHIPTAAAVKVLEVEYMVLPYSFFHGLGYISAMTCPWRMIIQEWI